jgi:nicotinamide riboside kinase
MEEHLKQAVSREGVLKIAIFGPESTGKTTLASTLAAQYATGWVPEFAREFLQAKWNNVNEICAFEDLLPIAEGQIQTENHAYQNAHRFLFCDTCLLQTRTYAQIYYRSCESKVEAAAQEHNYDLFLLTDIDVPWEKDDLRDRPDNREEMFRIFKQSLHDAGKPFIVISGNAQERLAKAIQVLESLEMALQAGLSSLDFVEIYNYGAKVADVVRQLAYFKNGIAKAVLDRPATPGDGIITMDKEVAMAYARYFEGRAPGLLLEKFVPASGAASRMFKFLSEYLSDYSPETESLNAYINRKNALELTVFLAGLEKFPFYAQITQKLAQMHTDFATWDRSKRVFEFIRVMLHPEHFGYADKPKGILPFHQYPAHIATPVEEHLNEAMHYAIGKDQTAHIHFTVSESHRHLFQKIVDSEKSKLETIHNGQIKVGFSYQDKSTDTLAVNPDNTPLRNSNGVLVFRPGGHGALIHNLAQLDAQIIFIKNIDNVIQNQAAQIALYKKALAGLLVELRDDIHKHLRAMTQGKIDEREILQITTFMSEKLAVSVHEDFDKYTLENKIAYLIERLNRPIRICGMVKNEGEPGGGPFWVRDRKGNLSLQIVESSQIDLQDPKQAHVLSLSTHFNPVDIVCSICDFEGDKFDLSKYIDHESGFVVQKNKDGKPLKAYELPGLWNGAMSKWITLFVEVPLITFNPVKTVNDLLKPAHQP